jgi:hypothetical protein
MRGLPKLQLPDVLAQPLGPLLETLPLASAMPSLLPTGSSPREAVDLAAEAAKHPTFATHPELAAGLWLYVDDLERSHTVSQSIRTPAGSMWHAIVHRREGDFPNSRYWLRQVGALHPALQTVEGYEPYGFLDQVSRRHAENPDQLVSVQRREWAALFVWCARRTVTG